MANRNSSLPSRPAADDASQGSINTTTPSADITNVVAERKLKGAKDDGDLQSPQLDGQTSAIAAAPSPESWSDEQRETAKQILTQAEYYFSDENLAKDVYLYGKMKGSKGKPVPVGLIHSFDKMRDFQPYEFVVEAIKASTKLQVVNQAGRDCIVRQKIFSRSEYETPGISKQKVEKPTGFEPYYADPPITPAEAEEEEDIYGDHNPFAERIQIAMQRYKSKRKFSAQKSDIWTKFIKFGGIETGPRTFTGRLSKEDMEDKTVAEISQLTATDFTREDQYELETTESKWVVDFEGVAKGFLSSVVSDYYCFSTKEQVEECTTVMLNFYNYLILHNVCPEYHDSINAARKVCGVANKELPGSCNIVGAFPGDFNIACSALFGGRWQTLLEDSPWMETSKDETSQDLTRQKAKQTVSLAAAANAPNEWWMKDTPTLRKDLLSDQQILGTEKDVGFEVTEIISADEVVRELYEPYSHTFKVVGKLICKPWTVPDFTQYDLPKGYMEDARPSQYEFWLEQDLLDLCSIGTKFKANSHKLSSGLHILDGVTNAYPSYHKLLLNELLYEPGSNKKWKEPREVTREEHLWRGARWLPKPAEDAEAATNQEGGKQLEPPEQSREQGETAAEAVDGEKAGTSV